METCSGQRNTQGGKSRSWKVRCAKQCCIDFYLVPDGLIKSFSVTSDRIRCVILKSHTGHRINSWTGKGARLKAGRKKRTHCNTTSGPGYLSKGCSSGEGNGNRSRMATGEFSKTQNQIVSAPHFKSLSSARWKWRWENGDNCIRTLIKKMI